MKRNYVKSYILLGLFFFPLYALSSQGGAKEGGNILIEEELEEEFQNLDEASSDEEIIVWGEDEQIIRPVKKSAVLTPPSDVESLRWSEARDILEKPGKSLGERREKLADARFFYGDRHSYGFEGDFLKSGDGKNYRMIYRRRSVESRAKGGEIVPNSSYSYDDFTYTEARKISESHKMFWKVNYTGMESGLEANGVYDGSSRSAGLFGWDNVFRFGESHQLEVSAQGEFIESRYFSAAAYTGGDLNSNYASGGGGLSWTFFFGKRASLVADLEHLSMAVQGESGEELYHEWEALIKTVFPVYLGYAGVNQLPLQLDLALGAGVYYEPRFGYIPAPYFQAIGRYGDWNSLLTLRRANGVAAIGRALSESPYYKAVAFDEVEDLWSLSWENGFPIQENDRLRLDLRAVVAERMYHPNVDADGLYYFEAVTSERYSFQPKYERELVENLFADIGFRYEYFTERVGLEPLFMTVGELRYESRLWNFTLDFSWVGERPLGGVTYDGAFILNSEIRYRFNAHSEFLLTAKDLADSGFSYFPTYASYGRNFFLGLSLKM